MTDFPAAHSTDSTWFAVDENGHIAVFDTGEGGAIPTGGQFPMGEEAAGGKRSFEASTLLAHALWARAETDQQLRVLLPHTKARLVEWIEKLWPEDLEAMLREAGVYTYDMDFHTATPYVRAGKVKAPLRLAQFSSSVQDLFTEALLPVTFANSKCVAAGEHTAVHCGGGVWYDLAGVAHGEDGAKPPEGTKDWVGPFTDDALGEAKDFANAAAFYTAVKVALDGIDMTPIATGTTESAPPSGTPVAAAAPVAGDKDGFGAFLRGLVKDKK